MSIKKYDYGYQNLDYELLQLYNYDVISYILEKARGKNREELDRMLANGDNQIDKIAIVEYLVDIAPKDKDLDFLTHFYPHLTDDFINYQFMSEEQRNIYHFLFSTEGEESANKYLDLISDSINQAYGAKMAADFISELDLNDKGQLEKNLSNFFDVSVEGLGDGISNFFSGLENVIMNNGTLSADEYKKIIVLQYLQENSDYYDDVYQFNSALGNMVPAIVTSAIVSLVATPAAGATTSSVLMGLSAGGNAKHQALVSGNGLLSSCLYGLFVGASEATLGYFLGKIPGISATSGFTLKNILSEGTEEFLQEWIDAGLQAVVLGENVDWSNIPKQSIDSFLMGSIMAGFLNGGSAIVNLNINEVKYELNVEDILVYMADNPKASITDAVSATNPKMSKFFKPAVFDDNVQNVTDYIVSQDSKISSFSEFLTKSKYYFNLFNQEKSVSVDYLNNTIFDSENYTSFCEYLKIQNNQEKIYEMTLPFYNLYQQIKNENIKLDPLIETRMKYISSKYLATFNSYRQTLSQYSYYGADQKSVRIIANNPSSNPTLYAELEQIVTKYFPELSKSNVNKFLRAIDVNGVCSYATVVNEIFVTFDGKEQLFKQLFGYDMYRYENGIKVLNDEVMLADLYCYVNKDNKSVIWDGPRGWKVAKNDKSAFCMSYGDTMDSKQTSKIEGWFNSKGLNLNWKSKVIYMCRKSGTTPKAASNITDNIKKAILQRHTVEIDIFSYNENPMDLILYSTDLSSYNDCKLEGKHQFGHSMLITGITESGDIIVSSWGREYILKWEELKKVRITINESYIQ